jgi:LuxR family maltose regulon positive regulatory protein
MGGLRRGFPSTRVTTSPAAFWAYLIAALQTVAPGIGASALSLMQGSQPPPIETVLATLLNELSGVPNDTVPVLDDYHLVDAHDIQDGMAFLLAHLPPQIHLVIATRADPALPLGRLRGGGALAEIRAADLRFTPDEAAAYLNEAMGLDLAARAVAALEERTEGWIAALQLAALSIQGRDDIAGFASSIGALLNTAALERRTWFIAIAFLGVFNCGPLAVFAYVIAGPNGTQRTEIASALAPSASAS